MPAIIWIMVGTLFTVLVMCSLAASMLSSMISRDEERIWELEESEQ